MFRSLIAAGALILAALSSVSAQTVECKTALDVHQIIEEANPSVNVQQVILTGRRAQWFIESYTRVTAQPAPTIDMLSLYTLGTFVLITGFNNGCYVGLAKVDPQVYLSIRTDMERARASSE